MRYRRSGATGRRIPAFGFVAILAWAVPARADEAGDKVLAAVDAASNRASTQLIEYEVTVQEPGRAERKLVLQIWTKGDLRLTEFLAPADVKGLKALFLSPDRIYVYLPAFGKVRRIASPAKDQGFMGLTFSAADLAGFRYSPQYTARIASETATGWNLIATPKPGETPDHARIELIVAKDKALSTELKYFDDAGTHRKTETRTANSCQGQVCGPAEIKMTDHTKGGHWTKLVRKAWKVNEPISDDVFTARALGL